MRRRMPHFLSKVLYLLSCLILLTLSMSTAQSAQTSDDLLYSQIRNSQIRTQAEAGSNDLQASVIIVAGNSVFIDAGRVAGVEKSNFTGGQLMRRSSNGEELIANFAIIEVGGEVSQVAVATVFGQEVQLGDRAVFTEYSARAGLPDVNGGTMQASSRKDSLNGLFADTDPNAGRAIGLANSPTQNTNTINNRAYAPDSIEVTKSSVIPAGSAAEALAGLVAGAVAKSQATGAPLYCSDARFAMREACMAAPVPLMGESTVAPVTIQAVATPSQHQQISQASSAMQQPIQQPMQQTVQQAQTAQVAATTALPGYCIDARFASRSECMPTGAVNPAVMNTAVAGSAVPNTAVTSTVPSYCSTPANQSRPECAGASSMASSHISTATAATTNVAAGAAMVIDPYTGKPYTTSYQGYNGDTATPLVHTAAHSQATHSQTTQTTVQVSAAPATNYNATIGLANSIGSSSTINVPAHVGPSTIANQTIANQTIAAPANTSYTTAQTYYDSDWGDNWDPTYVNTTPNASGIIPAGSPAPYYLRIARVKNNLGFPNEAIEILEMGLAQYPNEATLQSELTMIYRMLSDGGSPTDWCAPEEIGIAPEPIATVDDCPEEEVYDDHSHDHGHNDEYGHDHGHDDDYGHSHNDYDHDDDHGHSHDDDHYDDHQDNYSSEENQSYANDYQENIQVSTRYNAPLNNDAPLSNQSNRNANQSYAAQQEQAANANQSYAAQQTLDADVNQSYAAQNKPAFTSPLGMANGLANGTNSNVYNEEKGGIVRPAWNTNK